MADQDMVGLLLHYLNPTMALMVMAVVVSTLDMKALRPREEGEGKQHLSCCLPFNMRHSSYVSYPQQQRSSYHDSSHGQ